MKTILTTLALLLSVSFAKAQDTIRTTDKQTIIGHIVKSDSKYYFINTNKQSDTYNLKIKKSEILKITYSGGYTQIINNNDTRVEKPFGISMGLTGFTPGLISFSVRGDYFITPNFSAELLLGWPFYSNSINLNFFPVSTTLENRTLFPYIGFGFGNDLFDTKSSYVTIPLGLKRISAAGLQLGLNAQLIFSESQPVNDTELNFFGIEFSIGYRLGK